MTVPVAPGLLTDAAREPAAAPCVGDTVTVAGGRVVAVAPRRTAVTRLSVGGTSHEQVLAAGVDLVVVVEPLLPEPRPGRVERLLALAWASGATPLVVLTKADVVSDAEAMRDEIAAAAPGVDVLLASGTTGEGMSELAAYAAPGSTLVLLGPSGAGKSSLLNALAGDTVVATGATRMDGKGRHTTVRRQLVPLPGGRWVIDTPGLRGISLVADDEAVEHAFADIAELAEDCRFSDCGHVAEPGCAVLAALESGELPERRLASWRKLAREAAWVARRQDARLAAEERARWKAISREVRQSGRIRP